jgi:hypothetical protein
MEEIKKKYLIIKILLACLIVVSFAVIWASLHDIIKGEENITLEIFAAVLSFGALIFSILKFQKIKQKTFNFQI